MLSDEHAIAFHSIVARHTTASVHVGDIRHWDTGDIFDISNAAIKESMKNYFWHRPVYLKVKHGEAKYPLKRRNEYSASGGSDTGGDQQPPEVGEKAGGARACQVLPARCAKRASVHDQRVRNRLKHARQCAPEIQDMLPWAQWPQHYVIPVCRGWKDRIFFVCTCPHIKAFLCRLTMGTEIIHTPSIDIHK
jgi:hypothetical protein